MDFDQTLGFPGEGPVGFRPRFVVAFPLVSVWISVAPFAMAMPIGPRSQADRGRADVRATVPLIEGRGVLPETSRWRDSLFWSFEQWAISEGYITAYKQFSAFR